MDGNPGNGSCFQVCLPRSTQAAGFQTGITAPIPHSRERILYVDADPQMALVGQRVMEFLGYRVTALTRSLKARKVFNARPQEFDLLITDLILPRMSGMELAADLVKIRPDLPIIICSSFMGAFPDNIAWRLGIREFLTKPVSIVELARAIRRALDREQE